MADMSEKSSCPRAGRPKAECRCAKCVEALLRRHVPELLAEYRYGEPGRLTDSDAMDLLAAAFDADDARSGHVYETARDLCERTGRFNQEPGQ